MSGKRKKKKNERYNSNVTIQTIAISYYKGRTICWRNIKTKYYVWWYERWQCNNEYISNLKSVIENDFGKQFNNLNEIEMALQEKQEKI